ncbi:MFS transporter [Actinokineospora sp. UTMC 2448]|uniref:MFS transporter n=1 Tax=Actinokineospora sp. UTMC 2448 TaxID=2268449 RepID=UPI00216418A7|nr:MFS transporter [Actinokineospora sp. UTMC 2448]UVS77986.1 Major Facilitator Superfamily protein [Actinokineospora sp. UTMC 2448]
MRSTRLRGDAVARVIRVNAGFNFCFGLLWWLPVFYAYQRDAGLADSEIFGIQSIYYVAFCLLEIPTGMLADRFDYRRFLGAGAAVLLVANLVPVAWPTYAGFLAHFLLIALARSLVSGACSAYLYEYLDRSGARERYRDAEGKARSASLVGRVVCWPFVGLLMQVEHTLPYWLSAASAAGACWLALRLPALPDPVDGALGGPRAARPVWSALPQAFAALRRGRVLLLIMVQGVAVFTLVRVFQVNLAQPILAEKAVPLGVYGAIFAGMTLLESLGAARTGWLRGRLSDRTAVFLLTVAMAACLALAVPAEMVGTVAILGVFSLVSGLSYPIQRTLVNDAITDSRHRATMLSAESIIDRAVCALVVLALGGYLDAGALGAFLVHTAIATAVLMAVVAVALRHVRGTR